jgi:hypothetical protein
MVLNPFMTIRITVLLFTIMACGEAFSCTCIGSSQAKTMREVAEWYANRVDVALIFEGKVIKQDLHSGSAGVPATATSMTGSGRFRVVDFAIMRSFRGGNQDRVSVLTGLGTGDCGYHFQTGQTYLVYASKGQGGVWFTSICSGTNVIEDAGAALAFSLARNLRTKTYSRLANTRSSTTRKSFPNGRAQFAVRC